MRTIPVKCSQWNLPDNCIVFRKGKYIFRENGFEQTDLPSVSKWYEDLLQDMDIAYREEEGKLIYWDKDNYDTTEISGPIYREYFADYSYAYEYVGQRTVKRPTVETREAAKELQKLVEKQVEERKKLENEDMIISRAKEMLNGEDAVQMYKMEEMQELDEGQWDEYEIKRDDVNLKIIKVYQLRADPKYYSFPLSDPKLSMYNSTLFKKTSYVVVFDMDKCQKSPIEICAMENSAGLVIGKKGWHVRRWSSLLKRRIDVKRI